MTHRVTNDRKQGACLRCKKLERKCDQKQPQCTQCKKKNQECSLQVFRVNTIHCPSVLTARSRRPRPRVAGSSHTDNNSPKLPEASLTGSEGASYCLVSQDFSDPDLHENALGTLILHAESLLVGECESESSISKASKSDNSPSSYIEGTGSAADESGPITTPRYSLEISLSSGLSKDIVESPVRRLLWDYFINRASQVFLCWEPSDAKLDKAYRDPYSDNLPLLAMYSRPMMLASLALSAFHSAGGGRSHEDRSLITSLMLEAANALAALRWQQPQTFGQLLGTVGAASLLYLVKPSMYADMLTLSRSAALCLPTGPDYSMMPPLYQVIMQIFRWSDICSQCSLKQYVPIPDESTQLLLELRDNEKASNLSPSYADWAVHPLYAFPEELIAPLRRVAWLIRLRQHGCVGISGSVEDSDAAPLGASLLSDSGTCGARPNIQISLERFEHLVNEAEQLLHFARQKIMRNKHQQRVSEPTLPSSAAPDLRTDLHRLATAMDSAITILLLTRLRNIPWTAEQIRFHVRNVVNSLGDISPGSRFSNGIVFPLYIASLEAVDAYDRSVIISCIEHLPGLWSQRESELVACMRHVWSLRDGNPGATWISWIHQVSMGFEDCIPG